VRARLEAVHFGGGQYPRLAAVLALTARRHAPDWDVRVQQIPPHNLRAATGSDSHAANHHKLQAWERIAASAPDGARVLLVDADTFVTGPLDGIWEQAFDVAYTARDAARYPLNAGVIALRVGPETRAFMAAWLAQDALFLRDREAAHTWRQRYGGQNQASLGAILEAGVHTGRGLHLVALPCAEWNCEDTTWARFGPATRIVHVKSALRLDAFDVARTPKTRTLAAMWRALDAEARATEAAA
jgi:hypothetical protein